MLFLFSVIVELERILKVGYGVKIYFILRVEIIIGCERLRKIKRILLL